MVTDKERLPTLFLGDKESDIVLPGNPRGFSVIGGIECMFLLTLITNALSRQIFPLIKTRFLDLGGFTNIYAQIMAMATRFCRT